MGNRSDGGKHPDIEEISSKHVVGHRAQDQRGLPHDRSSTKVGSRSRPHGCRTYEVGPEMVCSAAENRKLEGQVAKAWCKKKMQSLILKEAGWAAVTGPTTGLAKTMTELGWNVNSPTKWTWQEHEIQRGDQQGQDGLLEVVASSIESKLWSEASGHRLGSGMEYGEPMLTPVTKLMQEYRKADEGGKATMVRQIAAGGVITPERLNEMFPEHDEVCRCGKLLPDEVHLYWDCKLLCEDRRPEVESTNWMTKKAKEELGLVASVSKKATENGQRHL